MTNENIDFESEISADSEADAILDDLIMAVAQKAKDDNGNTSIVVPTKLKLISESYKLLKYMFGNRVKVTYTLHKPYNSVGYITIEGKQIDIQKPSSFIAIVEAASNFEVFPTLYDKIVMNLTYHGLTQTIE